MRPVETKYGTMYMNIGAKYVKEHANMEFERGFLNIVENEDYDIFVDVGAAWGYFSIPASHFCDMVYAFEPQSKRMETLLKNIEILNIKNIYPSPLAVGTGELQLYINESMNGMVGPKGNRRFDETEVEWVSLYEVVRRYLDRKLLVKIDVEGNELDVVKSLGDLNKIDNVVFLIERHEFPYSGYSEETLLDFMKPFVGEKLGERGQTSHYVFRRVK